MKPCGSLIKVDKELVVFPLYIKTKQNTSTSKHFILSNLSQKFVRNLLLIPLLERPWRIKVGREK